MISAKDLRNVDLAVGASGYVTKDVDKLVKEAANSVKTKSFITSLRFWQAKSRNIVLRRTLSKPLL